MRTKGNIPRIQRTKAGGGPSFCRQTGQRIWPESNLIQCQLVWRKTRSSPPRSLKDQIIELMWLYKIIQSLDKIINLKHWTKQGRKFKHYARRVIQGVFAWAIRWLYFSVKRGFNKVLFVTPGCLIVIILIPVICDWLFFPSVNRVKEPPPSHVRPSARVQCQEMKAELPLEHWSRLLQL